jgi:hypothetical protein
MIQFPTADVHDTFLHITVFLLWILKVGLNPSHQYYNIHLMMALFLLLLPMEPRLAPLGRPTLMGPIGTLVIWQSVSLKQRLTCVDSPYTE